MLSTDITRAHMAGYPDDDACAQVNRAARIRELRYCQAAFWSAVAAALALTLAAVMAALSAVRHTVPEVPAWGIAALLAACAAWQVREALEALRRFRGEVRG